MTNNKQLTPVQFYLDKVFDIIGDDVLDKLSNEQLNKIRNLGIQAKEMEIAGKEMSYADGYKEGYKRALEVMEWYIKNHISGMPQDHIVDTNKMI
jgi:hypothetical protein